MTVYLVGAPGAAAAQPAGAGEKRFEDWGRIKGQDGKKKWVNRRRKRQREERRANRSKLSYRLTEQGVCWWMQRSNCGLGSVQCLVVLWSGCG